jgi:hypothetical protein
LRVNGSQQLTALFQTEPIVPTVVSTVVRGRPEIPEVSDDSELGEQMIKANRELLRNGLEKAGIKSTTIEKLRQFDDFAHNAGEFLIAALDLSHRSMVYLTVHLLEEAERIKTDYLDDAMLDDEYKIQWQQAYIDIVEQVGKCFDRTLIGTQAMAKLLGTDKGDTGKKKPGFRPLKRVEKAKNG